MKNNYYKIFLIILVVVFVVPQIALAAWWNPFSWNWGWLNNIFHFQKTEQKLDQNQNPVACTMEAKLCPDGSSVGREGPKCEFKACPAGNCVPEGRVFGANDLNLQCCSGLVFQPSPDSPSGTVGECVKKSNTNTADWKTYSNTEYGFSFKYPPDLSVYYAGVSPNPSLLGNVIIKGKNTEWHIWIYNNRKGIKEFTDKYPSEKWNDIAIVSLDAKSVSRNISVDPVNNNISENITDIFLAANYVYGFQKSNYKFNVLDGKKTIEYDNYGFDEMLSTFKFIDSPTSPVKCTSGSDCQQGYYCALPNVDVGVQAEGYCFSNDTPSQY